MKSSDATQTLDDQPLASSDIYSALHKLSSYASSTHSHVRIMYIMYTVHMSLNRDTVLTFYPYIVSTYIE